MPGMDMVQLRGKMEKQLAIDWFLLDDHILDLLTKPIDSMQGLLCDICILLKDNLMMQLQKGSWIEHGLLW